MSCCAVACASLKNFSSASVFALARAAQCRFLHLGDEIDEGEIVFMVQPELGVLIRGREIQRDVIVLMTAPRSLLSALCRKLAAY